MTPATPEPVLSTKGFEYERDITQPIDILNGASMNSLGQVELYEGEQRIEPAEFQTTDTEQPLPRYSVIDIGSSSDTQTRLRLGFTEIVIFDTQQVVLDKGETSTMTSVTLNGEVMTRMRSLSPQVIQCGRTKTCDVQIADRVKGASRVHMSAKVVTNGTKFVLLVQNTGSNGVFLMPNPQPEATELPEAPNKTIALRI